MQIPLTTATLMPTPTVDSTIAGAAAFRTCCHRVVTPPLGEDHGEGDQP